VAIVGIIVIFSRSTRLEKNIREGFLKILEENLFTLRGVWLLRHGIFMTGDISFKETFNENLISKSKYCFHF